MNLLMRVLLLTQVPSHASRPANTPDMSSEGEEEQDMISSELGANDLDCMECDVQRCGMHAEQYPELMGVGEGLDFEEKIDLEPRRRCPGPVLLDHFRRDGTDPMDEAGFDRATTSHGSGAEIFVVEDTEDQDEMAQAAILVSLLPSILVLVNFPYFSLISRCSTNSDNFL